MPTDAEKLKASQDAVEAEKTKDPAYVAHKQKIALLQTLKIKDMTAKEMQDALKIVIELIGQ